MTALFRLELKAWASGIAGILSEAMAKPLNQRYRQGAMLL
jgi:hypothetical protein